MRTTMIVNVDGVPQERECTVSYREHSTIDGKVHRTEKRTPVLHQGERLVETIAGPEIITGARK